MRAYAKVLRGELLDVRSDVTPQDIEAVEPPVQVYVCRLPQQSLETVRALLRQHQAERAMRWLKMMCVSMEAVL